VETRAWDKLKTPGAECPRTYRGSFERRESRSLAGETYDPFDPELTAKRKRARSLTRQFNESADEEGERRAAIMQELFAAVGDSVGIEPPLRCDYGSHISIGTGTFINFDCVILDCHRVTIGRHVLSGPRVQIYAATHPMEWAERIKGPMMGRPVVIGDHVGLAGERSSAPGLRSGRTP
jgi:maltose O-acetyltransferase